MIDRAWRLGLQGAYWALCAWWFVRRPTTRGVYVAVWCGDRVLLIKNSYKRRYTLPCGNLRRGESLADGAARELREEVGIDAHPDALTALGVIVSHHENKEDHCHFFELRFDDEPAVTVDRREVVWGAFLPVADALARPLWPPVERYLRDPAGACTAPAPGAAVSAPPTDSSPIL